MNKYDNILETDVLVIGGGFSGTWAAIKAREHVRNVLMVDLGRPRRDVRRRHDRQAAGIRGIRSGG